MNDKIDRYLKYPLISQQSIAIKEGSHLLFSLEETRRKLTSIPGISRRRLTQRRSYAISEDHSASRPTIEILGAMDCSEVAKSSW